MKKYFSALCAIFTLSFLSATGQAADETKPEAKPEAKPAADEVAIIKTAEGEMVVEFWRDVAPNTVENFTKLAKKGFYDGTAFHRIMKGFMIQGGDPLTKDAAQEDRWGMGDPGYKIKAELNERKHVRGVISMARGPGLDTAGSQFFICLEANKNTAYLDGKYTAFGKLIKGEDVLMKLAETPVAEARGEASKPLKRVGVESVKIVPRSEIK